MRRTRHFGRTLIKVVLVVTLVLACIAVPVTISRYIERKAVEDNATAATFEITQTGNFVKTYIFNVYPNGDFKQNIILKNGSEVDIQYTVTARLKYQVIDGMSFVVENGTGTLEAGESTPDNSIYVGVNWPKTPAPSYKNANIVDVLEVTVICEQVD